MKPKTCTVMLFHYERVLDDSNDDFVSSTYHYIVKNRKQADEIAQRFFKYITAYRCKRMSYESALEREYYDKTTDLLYYLTDIA